MASGIDIPQFGNHCTSVTAATVAGPLCRAAIAAADRPAEIAGVDRRAEIAGARRAGNLATAIHRQRLILRLPSGVDLPPAAMLVGT
jgi:hypothetical protein